MSRSPCPAPTPSTFKKHTWRSNISSANWLSDCCLTGSEGRRKSRIRYSPLPTPHSPIPHSPLHALHHIRKAFLPGATHPISGGAHYRSVSQRQDSKSCPPVDRARGRGRRCLSTVKRDGLAVWVVSQSCILPGEGRRPAIDVCRALRQADGRQSGKSWVNAPDGTRGGIHGIIGSGCQLDPARDRGSTGGKAVAKRPACGGSVWRWRNGARGLSLVA